MATNIDIRRWVDQYIEESDGTWFYTEHIWRRFNIITKAGKDVVYQRLKECVATKKVEKDGLRYRKRQVDLEDIDIFEKGDFVSIKFPFDLHRYVRLTEGSEMVVAGGKDSGKTAFLLNTAYLNMDDWEVHYFDSESGGVLLRERLLGIDPEIENPLHFKIHDRMSNFPDVIFPDALNIIDYLDLDSEFQMVGTELRRIVEALDKGVAIVGLQKPPSYRTKTGKLVERKLGYGGVPTIKRAQLALSLDPGKLQIIAAKSRVNKKINPVNKMWTYQMDESNSRFLNIQDSMGTLLEEA